MKPRVSPVERDGNVRPLILQKIGKGVQRLTLNTGAKEEQ